MVGNENTGSTPTADQARQALRNAQQALRNPLGTAIDMFARDTTEQLLIKEGQEERQQPGNRLDAKEAKKIIERAAQNSDRVTTQRVGNDSVRFLVDGNFAGPPLQLDPEAQALFEQAGMMPRSQNAAPQVAPAQPPRATQGAAMAEREQQATAGLGTQRREPLGVLRREDLAPEAVAQRAQLAAVLNDVPAGRDSDPRDANGKLIVSSTQTLSSKPIAPPVPAPRLNYDFAALSFGDSPAPAAPAPAPAAALATAPAAPPAIFGLASELTTSTQVAQAVYNQRDNKEAATVVESFLKEHGVNTGKSDGKISTQEREDLGKLLVRVGLKDDVAALSQALQSSGVAGGDRVPPGNPPSAGTSAAVAPTRNAEAGMRV